MYTRLIALFTALLYSWLSLTSWTKKSSIIYMQDDEAVILKFYGQSWIVKTGAAPSLSRSLITAVLLLGSRLQSILLCICAVTMQSQKGGIDEQRLSNSSRSKVPYISKLDSATYSSRQGWIFWKMAKKWCVIQKRRQVFATCAPLNFFVSEPISKI